jgi:hypothetical protein
LVAVLLQDIKLFQILDKLDVSKEAFKSVLSLLGILLLKEYAALGLKLVKLLRDLVVLILDSYVDFVGVLLDEQELVTQMLGVVFKQHPIIFEVVQVVRFDLGHQRLVAWFELALDVFLDFLEDGNVIVFLAFDRKVLYYCKILVLHL